MKTLLTLLCMTTMLIFTACSTDNKSNTGEDEIASASESGNGEAPENGRYGIATGMYVTKTTQTGAPAEMDIQTTVYFDNYGENEYTVTLTKISVAGYNNETRAYSLRKGMMMYSWNEGQNTGTKMDISTMMDKNMNYESMSEEMKKQFNYKEIGSETILGKKCKKISMEMEQGAKVEVSTWKGIPMKSVANMMGIVAIIEVTSLQENPAGVSAKMALPEGITFSELTYPAGI